MVSNDFRNEAEAYLHQVVSKNVRKRRRLGCRDERRRSSEWLRRNLALDWLLMIPLQPVDPPFFTIESVD